MRYVIDMDVRDIIRSNLRYALWLTGGYAALADKSKSGSAKYFEQVATGFQGEKDKAPRSLGPKVSASVAEAIGEDPSWMYQEHRDLWGAIGNRADVVPGAKEVDGRPGAIKAFTNDQLVAELASRLIGKPEIELKAVLVSIELAVSRAQAPDKQPLRNAG